MLDRCKGVRLGLAGLAALCFASSAAAQYVFNENNFDEQGPGTKFFGSVKDDRGTPIVGATILIDRTFVLVTDYTGRYRGNVGSGQIGIAAPVDCAKPGYKLVRAAKRPGPPGPKKSVQVDCVLHAVK